MIRQAHQHHCLHKRGGSHKVPKASARKVEGFAHGAGHHQSGGVLLQQCHRRGGIGKLGVGFIDNHNARRGIKNGANVIEAGHAAGGVVGGGDENNVGLFLRDGAQRCVHVNVKVLPDAGAVEKVCVGARGEDGVHGVTGLESQSGAPRPTECLQELLEYFVGTVGGPQVLMCDGHAGLRGDVFGQGGA